MGTVHANGIDIHFQRSGVGKRLLFINGSGATLAGSRPLIEAYARHFDTLAHDQRGLGLTSVPSGPYTMAEYAADAAALAQQVGWNTYGVVGTSFGGMVAQELAVTFPSRIERLALVCTSSGGAGGSSYPLHELLDLTDGDRAAARVELLDTRFTPEWLAAHDSDRMIAELASAPRLDQSADMLRGERLQLEARRYFDAYDRLGRITCPTLVASGRFDGIAPPSNGQAIAAAIADAEFRVYEGGHLFFYQDKQALPDIIAFLNT